MKTSRSGVVRWALPSLLAIAGVGAANHLSGAAPAVVASPQPVTVGVVDLVKLMSGLQKAAYLNALGVEKNKQRQASIDEMKTKLKTLKDEIEALPKSSEKERREKYIQHVELEQTISGRFEALQRVINVEKGDMIRELYLDIEAATDAYAQKNGYDLIIVDDRAMEIPEQATQDQVNMVIQNKRLLFARDTMDITEALIREMNNQFQAPPGYNPAPAPAPETPK